MTGEWQCLAAAIEIPVGTGSRAVAVMKMKGIRYCSYPKYGPGVRRPPTGQGGQEAERSLTKFVEDSYIFGRAEDLRFARFGWPRPILTTVWLRHGSDWAGVVSSGMEVAGYGQNRSEPEGKLTIIT